MPTPWNALAIKSGGTSGTTPLSARRALGISEGATTDNMVSVKDFPFRAVGDGVTDDTAAVQAAIDALSAAGGGRLNLPRGTYLHATGLIWKDGVSPFGEGKRASILKYSGAGIGNDTSYTAADARIKFSDFQITAAASTIGLRFTNASDVVLDGIEINGGPRTGNTISALQLAPSGLVLNVIIDKCNIHENVGYGIQDAALANDVLNHIVITNSMVRANDINIKGTSELLQWMISGCDLEAGATCAVQFTDIYGLTLIGNYFEQTTTPAIKLLRAAVAGPNICGIIQGNLLIGSSGSGIVVGTAGGPVNGLEISGNSFSSWTTQIEVVAANGLRIGPNSHKFAVTADITIAAGCSGIQIHRSNNRTVVTYSASMTADCTLGTDFQITATNGTAFIINAPTNPADDMVRTFTIRNTSGGALGAATWNAVFKMSAWTNPANGNSRSITFRYDGTNWLQIAQTGVDVPN